MITLPAYEKPEPTPQAPLYDAETVIKDKIGRGKEDRNTGLYVGDLTVLNGQTPVDFCIRALEPLYEEHATTYRYAVAATVASRIYGMVRVGFEIAAECQSTISLLLEGFCKHPASLDGRFATNGYPSSARAFVFVATEIHTRQWDDAPGGDYTISPSAPIRALG